MLAFTLMALNPMRMLLLAVLFFTAQMATAAHAIEHRHDAQHQHYLSCELFAAAEHNSIASGQAPSLDTPQYFTPTSAAPLPTEYSAQFALYSARAPPHSC